MPGGNVIAKIEKATVYRCVDADHLSRNNTASQNVMFEGDNGLTIFQALEEFADAEVRCHLVLVLSNGLEINIVPTLKDEVPAVGEEHYADYWDKPEDERDPKIPFDLSISFWPVLEPDFGLLPGEIDE